MRTKTVTLAHGNGGRLSAELIDQLFGKHFGNSLNTQVDAAALNLNGKFKITTDGFTVNPLFFPGGDIGKLAVCGTVNDLAVSGARAKFLTINFFIEEGFSYENLERICQSISAQAALDQVAIVAGDTKVLPKGDIQGLYLVTTGIGETRRDDLDINQISPGDEIYVSGTVGDHGAAVLLAREDYGYSGDLLSDCQSVQLLASSLLRIPTLKFMRDPTRGGLATVCHEIRKAINFGITLQENKIPLQPSVVSLCDMLGFNPLYLASEGRILFVITPASQASSLVPANCTKIGFVEDSHQQVLIQTAIGGLTILPELEGDPLPRIC